GYTPLLTPAARARARGPGVTLVTLLTQRDTDIFAPLTTSRGSNLRKCSAQITSKDDVRAGPDALEFTPFAVGSVEELDVGLMLVAQNAPVARECADRRRQILEMLDCIEGCFGHDEVPAFADSVQPFECPVQDAGQLLAQLFGELAVFLPQEGFGLGQNDEPRCECTRSIGNLR